MEDRHSISEKTPPHPKPYRGPQNPPRSQYEFEDSAPRQVQLGPPLSQRRNFEVMEPEEDVQYEIYEEPDEFLPLEDKDFDDSESFAVPELPRQKTVYNSPRRNPQNRPVFRRNSASRRQFMSQNQAMRRQFN